MVTYNKVIITLVQHNFHSRFRLLNISSPITLHTNRYIDGVLFTSACDVILGQWCQTSPLTLSVDIFIIHSKRQVNWTSVFQILNYITVFRYLKLYPTVFKMYIEMY